MGSPTATTNVCYKNAAYMTSLALAEKLGFDVESDKAEAIAGNAACEGSMFVLLQSNPGKECNTGKVTCWTMDNGRAYLARKISSLPMGIKAVLGKKIDTDDANEQLKYKAIQGYYQCATAKTKDPECENNVAGKVQTTKAKLEEQQQIADLVKRGNMMFDRADKLFKEAKAMELEGSTLGVFASDISDVIAAYTPEKKTKIDTLEEANEYFNKADEMLKRVEAEDSAQIVIKNRGKKVGCVVTENIPTPAPKKSATCKNPRGGNYTSVMCYGIEGHTGYTIDNVKPSCGDSKKKKNTK